MYICQVGINDNDFHKIKWNSLSEKKIHLCRVVSKLLGGIYSQVVLLAPGYADIELSVHFLPRIDMTPNGKC